MFDVAAGRSDDPVPDTTEGQATGVPNSGAHTSTATTAVDAVPVQEDRDVGGVVDVDTASDHADDDPGDVATPSDTGGRASLEVGTVDGRDGAHDSGGEATDVEPGRWTPGWVPGRKRGRRRQLAVNLPHHIAERLRSDLGARRGVGNLVMTALRMHARTIAETKAAEAPVGDDWFPAPPRPRQRLELTDIVQVSVSVSEEEAAAIGRVTVEYELTVSELVTDALAAFYGVPADPNEPVS